MQHSDIGFPGALLPSFDPMRVEDLDAIMDLEERSFPTPWTAATYRQELRNRTASYWVVRAAAPHADTPPILAYAGLWHLGEEAHITTIAVHPAWRRRSLGEWTLLHLLGKARDAGADSVTLEVRVANRSAIALYHKLGFVTVGVRRGYYQATGEDARLLTLNGLSRPALWAELHSRIADIEAGRATEPIAVSPEDDVHA